tara:strand:+ start:1010 stop:1462 length:453 start_codon:yes stop_codon:yes gene_type:complete
MQPLNFPESYHFEMRISDQKQEILDPIRQQFVSLTPEEWVRQNLVQFLKTDLGYPKGLIRIEQTIKLDKKTYRADFIVHKKNGQPILLGECKEPETEINQRAFDQIANYNRALNCKYLLVSNGLKHYCYSIDLQGDSHRFLPQIPKYSDL